MSRRDVLNEAANFHEVEAHSWRMVLDTDGLFSRSDKDIARNKHAKHKRLAKGLREAAQVESV